MVPVPGLETVRAALAARATTPFNIVCLGDSMTEGQGATAFGNRWVDVLRTTLRSRFPTAGVTGGAGLISPTNGLVSESATVFPVVNASTVLTNSQSGPKKRNRRFTGAGQISTWTVTGTSADIMYWQGTTTGTVKWSVDGGATTNLATAGASSAGGTMLRISLGASGVHTVAIEWVSGTSYIEGLVVYDGDETAGIRVHEAGKSGESAYNWDQVNHEATTAWSRSVAQLNPHLVIIGLGINDFHAGTVTKAQYKSALSSMIADIRTNTATDPTFMLIGYPKPNDTGNDPFTQFYDAMFEIADADAEIVSWDSSPWIRDSTTDTEGLYSGTTHFSDLGHARFGAWMAYTLTNTITLSNPQQRTRLYARQRRR